MTSRVAKNERRRKLVADALVQNGFKLTKPRMLVIACLLDGKHAHTAEEICRHIEAAYDFKPNLKSVYAVLGLLARLNLVHDYLIGGKHRFELTAGADDHIHVLVDEHEKLQTLPIGANLRSALQKTAADAGYAIMDVQIVLHVKDGKS